LASGWPPLVPLEGRRRTPLVPLERWPPPPFEKEAGEIIKEKNDRVDDHPTHLENIGRGWPPLVFLGSREIIVTLCLFSNTQTMTTPSLSRNMERALIEIEKII